MVNWVEAQLPLLRWLVRLSGLRQTSVELEPGTVMSFWVPKEYLDRAKKMKVKVSEVLEVENPPAEATSKKESKKEKKKKEKPAVVLVHGFAGEGLVTWQFLMGPLSKEFSVFVPDLLFFGRSTSGRPERSPEFQAECLRAALRRLGVARCTVVGFSYGGMVAFKLAEKAPEMVTSLVVSGSVIAMTDSISGATLERLGFSSSAELLLPETVEGSKALLSVAAAKKLWFPDFLHRDFLKLMYNNRKERAELLEGLVISNKDATVPVLSQRILLLWGEKDEIFKIELARKMKEQLGEKAKLETLEKAGHLAHIERPCAYTRHLKRFLSLVNSQEPSPQGGGGDTNRL